jgi:4-hydroxy-tetrahydrodipicolinate synthase
MARFGSLVTAMVTPFHSDGDIDLDTAGQVARHLASTGSEALVVAGTTGEGPVLTDAERLDLFRAVVEAVDVPVIASTGTNDTAHSVLLTREAKACGASGVLAVTPYYNRPSAAGLSAHFRAVAEATDLPVLLYDIPVRSGRRIGTELVVELARDVPTIVGVKDSTGDVAGAATIVAESPAGFDVYCGDDSLTLPFAAIGGAGIVSVAAHWAGPLFVTMLASHAAGEPVGLEQLPVRVHRRVPQSRSGQGCLPGPRAGRRPVPATQRPRSRRPGRPGWRRHRQAGSPRP